MPVETLCQTDMKVTVKASGVGGPYVYCATISPPLDLLGSTCENIISKFVAISHLNDWEHGLGELSFSQEDARSIACSFNFITEHTFVKTVAPKLYFPLAVCSFIPSVSVSGSLQPRSQLKNTTEENTGHVLPVWTSHRNIT